MDEVMFVKSLDEVISVGFRSVNEVLDKSFLWPLIKIFNLEMN